MNLFKSEKFFLYLALVLFNACMSADTQPESSAPPVLPIQNTKNIKDINNTPFIENPVPSNFSICHGHTCEKITLTELSIQEWDSIRLIFTEKSASADIERTKIAQAVGQLETIVGAKTSTAGDKGENFPGLGTEGQMDCIDESTNTTVYLSMIQNEGLLQWHRVSYRESRGVLTLQVPHFTAVIQQNDTSQKYAVDSWFLDNGRPPFIINLDEWENGWMPP